MNRRVGYTILCLTIAMVSSVMGEISRSKHDNTEGSKFERRTTSGGSGIARNLEFNSVQSKFGSRVVSRWSNAKRARIAREKAARAKAARSSGRSSRGRSC